MIATMGPKKRMGWSDYIVVCVRQSLMGAGQTDLPDNTYELYAGMDENRWPVTEFQAAVDLANELFGIGPCEDGTQLFKVKTLDLKESAIAAQMDLTHAEKKEAIRPLREKRRARSEAAKTRAAARPYKPTKAELEFKECERLRKAEEAALPPEERERRRQNSEANRAWLGTLMAPFVATGEVGEVGEEEEEEDYGVLPSELFPSTAGAIVPVDVVERTFEEHLTDTARIHARALGIQLD